MTEVAASPPRQFDGPPRAQGAKLVQPRRAATLLIVRRDGPKPRLLMGRRNGGHNFMPNLWVFPGGRLDRKDFRAPHGSELRPEVAAVFSRYLGPNHGRALALAAIRETFEEAGLLLALPAPPRNGAGSWREFLAQGALPDLAAIDIMGRAITPPMVAKRFDTWFLMADAERLISLERQPDCGELDEIAWIDADAALEINLPNVTRQMMAEALERVADPARPRILRRWKRGTQGWEHL